MNCKYCQEKIGITDFITNGFTKICFWCKETKDKIEQEKYEKEQEIKDNERMDKINPRRRYFE